MSTTIMSSTPAIMDQEKRSGSDSNLESQSEGTSVPPEPNDPVTTTTTTKPTPAAAADNLPPDGGLRAWLQVLGSFFLFMNSWGLVNTYGAFQTYYELSLLSNHSPADVSWIGSLQAFLLLMVGIATGPLFDMGYFHLLLNTGSFLVVFGMMMTSLCTQYWQVMLSQGLVVGLGFGCLFVPSVAIVSTYFSTRKAFATGIAASGSSLGGVLYTIVFARLQPRIGFPWATRVIGFLALAGLALCVAVMRVRVFPRSTRRLLEPKAFKEVPYTAFSIGQFLGVLGMWVPFFYIQSYSIAQGMDRNLAFYMLTILNSSSILGRVVPNYFADKWGPLTVMTLGSLGSAVLAFGWIGIKSDAGIIVFCLLYGFFSGSFVSLPAPAVASLSPSLGVLGARMGMSFSFAGLGILLGNPIGGFILREHGWIGLQAWAGATIAAATIASAIARFSKAPALRSKA